MINLCEVFGVEEGEIFCFKGHPKGYFYRISNNVLLCSFGNKECFSLSNLSFNEFNNLTIIRKPKLSDFEKAFAEKYKDAWMVRHEDGEIEIYENKPSKDRCGCWENGKSAFLYIEGFEDVFTFVKWEDEEPTKISDLLDEY